MEKNGESKGNLRSAQKIFRRMKILAFFMLVWLIQVKGKFIPKISWIRGIEELQC